MRCEGGANTVNYLPRWGRGETFEKLLEMASEEQPL